MSNSRYKIFFWIATAACLLWGATQIFSASTNLKSTELVINEFLAANRTGLTDEDGDYSDWIEIYNPGRTAVNLSGWSLTDDAGQPEKWTFPNISLAGGEYLLLFASGKNRIPGETGTPLHTNFKLNREGEFLGLYNILDCTWVDVTSPELSQGSPYSKQFRDISYGRGGDKLAFGYLATPTPGALNDETVFWAGLVSAVEFSLESGFYDQPFMLELVTSTPGAVIRYTTDGSEATESNGLLYTTPVAIKTSTSIRAAAFKPNFLPSYVDTHSYIFLDEVLKQPPAPPGWPATWGIQPKNFRGYVKGEPMAADYEVDPEVVNDARYRRSLKDDLKAIPSLSIVIDRQHFTELYSNPRSKGREWERPVSVEFIDPTGNKPRFQINAGLRLHGGEVRWEFIPKHAFRLFFRGDYGAGKLQYPLFDDSPVETFDTLVLRGGGGYAGRPEGDKSSITHIKDQWLRSSQRAMSGISSHGAFVHLYLNGLYWGLYNVVERPDASFTSSHFGGKQETWFALNHNGLISGPLNRVKELEKLFANLGHNLEDPEKYAALKPRIDIAQFIDYVILNWYTGNRDWPETNWYLGAQEPLGQIMFFVWDGEGIWNEGAEIILGPSDPHNLVKPLFEGLIQNPDFKIEFADRMYKHLFNDGVLTGANSQARWQKISRLIDRAVVGESARWGDTRNDPPVTRADWLKALDEVLAQMDGNAARLIALTREAGYYPDLDPPLFNQPDGLAPAGFNLTMTLSEKDRGAGTIYYTTDGSDPRVEVTGDVSPNAMVYHAPLVLTRTTHIKARMLAGDSSPSPGRAVAQEGDQDTASISSGGNSGGNSSQIWSALHEATFSVVERDSQLVITEIMYNPIEGDDYEFIELQNTGNSELDISGVYFEGLDFSFPAGTAPLAPKEFVVLARNPAALAQKYPGLDIKGVYSGQLSNKGEKIILKDFRDNPIMGVEYDDENGWPISPDGRGDSLVIRNPKGELNNPKNWQASPTFNGSPGTADSIP